MYKLEELKKVGDIEKEIDQSNFSYFDDNEPKIGEFIQVNEISSYYERKSAKMVDYFYMDMYYRLDDLEESRTYLYVYIKGIGLHRSNERILLVKGEQV